MNIILRLVERTKWVKPFERSENQKNLHRWYNVKTLDTVILSNHRYKILWIWLRNFLEKFFRLILERINPWFNLRLNTSPCGLEIFLKKLKLSSCLRFLNLRILYHIFRKKSRAICKKTTIFTNLYTSGCLWIKRNPLGLLYPLGFFLNYS